MAEDKKISFSAVDNGVSNFMKRLAQDTKALYNEFAKEAKEQSKNQKEQLRFIQDQIKALERVNDLEREQSRIMLDRQLRNKSISQRDYEQKLGGINAAFATDRLQTKMLRDHHETAAAGMTPEKKQPSVFSSVLAAGLLRDLFAVFRQTSSARTEFDLISPFGQFAGSAMGAGIGSIAEAATLGQIEYATIGANMGKEIGGFVGDALTREIQESERFLGAASRVGGLTGTRGKAHALSMFGMDVTESAQLEEQIVRGVGRAVTGNEVKNVAAISKAFTIDSSLIAEFKGLSRMGAATNETQVGEFLAEGIDRSRLADAMTSSISIMQQMGQSMLAPSRLDALQKVTEFNKVGGPFSVGDPRSAGLISTIQSNLISPSSPFAQAMGFSVLRRQNPNMGALDLMIERQKGSTMHLRGIMNDIAAGGGSEDFQVMQFANTVGLTDNLAAARKLFRGRGQIAAGGTQIAGMSDEQMQKVFQQAQAFTPEIEQSQAAVTNAFVDSFTKGIDELATRFTKRLSKAVDDWVRDKFVPKLPPKK